MPYSIEKNPLDATLYCNRELTCLRSVLLLIVCQGAYTRMKLEEQGYAIDDCSEPASN